MKTKQLLLTLLTVLLPLASWAGIWQDPETKVNYEYTPGSGVASVAAGYSGAGSPDATGDIAIRSMIIVDSIGYSVTSIGHDAFHRRWGLTSITIPGSVTSIGDRAFYGCKLSKVWSLIKQPFAIEEWVFVINNVGHFTDATLYVPAGTKALYEATEGWKKFRNGGIVEQKKGDLDRNGLVSITDAVLIVDVMAGTTTDAYMEVTADVNDDNNVNIIDCVAAINLIAAQMSNEARMDTNGRRAMADIETTSDFISATMQDNRLTVALDNEHGYTAFQMVVTVPEGMTIGNITMDKTRGTDHIALVRNLGNGQYLVAGFSASNSVLNGNSGSLLSITTDGQATGDIVVSNVTFVTPETEGYRLADAVAGTTTGIDDLQIDNLRFDSDGGSQIVNRKSVNSKCYDLQGRRVAKPTKGLYIINGKKRVGRKTMLVE